MKVFVFILQFKTHLYSFVKLSCSNEPRFFSAGSKFCLQKPHFEELQSLRLIAAFNRAKPSLHSLGAWKVLFVSLLSAKNTPS